MHIRVRGRSPQDNQAADGHPSAGRHPGVKLRPSTGRPRSRRRVFLAPIPSLHRSTHSAQLNRCDGDRSSGDRSSRGAPPEVRLRPVSLRPTEPTPTIMTLKAGPNQRLSPAPPPTRGYVVTFMSSLLSSWRAGRTDPTAADLRRFEPTTSRFGGPPYDIKAISVGSLGA